MSDSLGRFTVIYLAQDSIPVEVTKDGYKAARARVMVHARDTARIEFALERAPSPCCSLSGQWALALDLDSAGLDQHPTARRVEGSLVLSRAFPSPIGGRSDRSDSLVDRIDGEFTVDLRPVWGTQVASGVSTTVFGTADSSLEREAAASIFDGDSVEITLIPRLSHGSLSLGGRLKADTLVGGWSQNAYCCGAFGHFRMVRRSTDPGPVDISAAPEPEVAETLARADRADVRVRVWDAAVGGYIRNQHELVLPSGDIWSPYYSGSGPNGWGEIFSVPPGRYAVLIDVFQCGQEQFWVKHDIKRSFRAVAGGQVDLTIQLDTRTLQPGRSYNNTDGHRCREPSTSSP